MPQFPLFGLGQQGKSTAVSAQRHLNLYGEVSQEPDKTLLALYGTGGLLLFTTFGDTPARGMIAVGDYIYVVHRGTFWQVDNAGTKTSRGSLTTTSGRVDIAYNGTQIAITDATSMYSYNIGTLAFGAVASGLFVNPITVTYQDSYVIAGFLNSQRFQISASGDDTTWASLDFASAQSNPDNIVRLIADHGELCIFGDLTIEFWGNSGGADFPYSIIKGATIEYGLAAAWSLVKYNDSLAFLAKNRMGQVQVMMMAGHALRRISTDAIDTEINGYTTVSDATAFSYMWFGHPMFQINFPTAGKSWLYDGSTNMWSPLESGLDGGRHLAEIHVDYLNKPRVSDYANGNIYNLDASTYTDNGTSIKRQLIGKHFFKDGKRIAINSLQVEFEPGIGLATGQGSAPQAMLQISRDGGKTFGAEMWRSIGKVGEYLARAIWHRLGSARDWIFKLTITDPVKVVITVANIDAEVRK
jgi:hypothetical protein